MSVGIGPGVSVTLRRPLSDEEVTEIAGRTPGDWLAPLPRPEMTPPSPVYCNGYRDLGPPSSSKIADDVLKLLGCQFVQHLGEQRKALNNDFRNTFGEILGNLGVESVWEYIAKAQKLSYQALEALRTAENIIKRLARLLGPLCDHNKAVSKEYAALLRDVAELYRKSKERTSHDL